MGLHATSSGHHSRYLKVRDQGCADALDVCQEMKVCVRKLHFPGEYPRESAIFWGMSCAEGEELEWLWWAELGILKR